MNNRTWSLLIVGVLLGIAFFSQLGLLTTTVNADHEDALLYEELLYDLPPITDLSFDDSTRTFSWSEPTGVEVRYYDIVFYTGKIPLHTEDFTAEDFTGCWDIWCGGPIISSEGTVSGVIRSEFLNSKKNWTVKYRTVDGQDSSLGNVLTIENGELVVPNVEDQEPAWSNGAYYWYAPENVHSYSVSLYTSRDVQESKCFESAIKKSDLVVRDDMFVCESRVRLVDVDFVPGELESLELFPLSYPIRTQSRGQNLYVDLQAYDQAGNLIMDHQGVKYDLQRVPYDNLPRVDSLAHEKGSGFITWSDPIENEYVYEYKIGYLTGRAIDVLSSKRFNTTSPRNCYYSLRCGVLYYEGDLYKERPYRLGYTMVMEYTAMDGRTSERSYVYVPFDDEPADAFVDISTNFYREAINEMAEAGKIEGFEGNYFAPRNRISRAEFVKMLVLAEYADEFETVKNQYTESCFLDVPAEAWYLPYVCFAADRGLVDGYYDNTFQPFKTITAAEATKLVLTNLGFEPNYVANEEEPWYLPYLEIAEDQAFYLETSDYKFWQTLRQYAERPFNRAEAAGLLTLDHN